MIRGDVCLNCWFWVQSVVYPEVGRCRRYPPKIVNKESAETLFGVTGKHIWCGEWKDCGEEELGARKVALEKGLSG